MLVLSARSLMRSGGCLSSMSLLVRLLLLLLLVCKGRFSPLNGLFNLLLAIDFRGILFRSYEILACTVKPGRALPEGRLMRAYELTVGSIHIIMVVMGLSLVFPIK